MWKDYELIPIHLAAWVDEKISRKPSNDGLQFAEEHSRIHVGSLVKMLMK